MDNAVTTSLPELATCIRADIERYAQGHEAVVTAMADLCRHLAEARAKFTADREFGAWLDQEGLGTNVLNDHDRAAAIFMGQHLEHALPVLEKTERRSLQLICNKEVKPLVKDRKSRFASVSKPASKPATQPKAAAEHPKPASTPRQRATTTDEQIKDRVGDLLKHTDLSQDEIAEKAGTSRFQVRKVQAYLEGKGELDAPQVDLSSPMKARYEAALRAGKRKMEAEFNDRVQEAAKRFIENVILPGYEEKLAEATKIVKNRRGLIKRAQYRLLIGCLHPDKVAHFNLSEADLARYSEAFQLIHSLELSLLDEQERPTSTAAQLPKTLAEMLARKEQVQRERRERRERQSSR